MFSSNRLSALAARLNHLGGFWKILMSGPNPNQMKLHLQGWSQAFVVVKRSPGDSKAQLAWESLFYKLLLLIIISQRKIRLFMSALSHCQYWLEIPLHTSRCHQYGISQRLHLEALACSHEPVKIVLPKSEDPKCVIWPVVSALQVSDIFLKGSKANLSNFY